MLFLELPFKIVLPYGLFVVVAVLSILALGGAGFWYFRKVKKRQARGGGSGAQGSGGGRQAVELKSIAAEVNGDGDYMPPALPTGIGGDPAADAQQAAPTTDFVKMVDEDPEEGGALATI